MSLRGPLYRQKKLRGDTGEETFSLSQANLTTTHTRLMISSTPLTDSGSGMQQSEGIRTTKN